MSDVQPIPAGHPTIVPHLVVRAAAEAIEFYKRAFAAEEVSRMLIPGTDVVMHAELRFGSARIFICDETPHMERWVSPKSLNGTTVALNVWSDNADELFSKAVKAGAKVVLPLADMFWGDRYGRVTDPFGHEWAIAQHVKDVSPEEMSAAIAAMASAQDDVKP